MLDAFLTDFAEIRDKLDSDGDYNFFGKNFSFFSAEPILFYNNEKDVIVYANSMFSNEFNYTVEDLAQWKYSIYPLLNTEDQSAFKSAMKVLLDGDENSVCPDASYRLVNKGKKYSYYRVKIRKLHKSHYYIQLENSVKAAIPVLRNKTADELMNNAESILKFGFWMWDISADKLYWTKGMYHLLEYDTDEEMDMSITPEFYHSHILKNDTYLEFEKRFKAGNVKDAYRNKFQLKTNKGSLLTVFEHANIEYDEQGKIKYVTGITRDITIQEESMKSLADYKAMMLENETFLNYGTWESDLKGNTMFWSDGMYNIFGYEEAEKNKLVINKELYFQHMNPEDYQRGVDNNLAMIEEKDNFQWDYEIKDNKGVVKILSTFGKIIRNNEQKIEKIIGATRDVTELRGYEKTLENKISELNRSNRELEEFAYVASHDLQEPLRKISTFSQRLQIKFSDKLGEDGNLYINRVVAACENMRKLIDNLLEFSRISLNNPPPRQVDLSEIVNQAIDDLDLVIAETNTTIKVGLLPSVEAISSQMLQLFVNILNNSIKFRKGNIPLQIKINARKLGMREKTEHQLSSKSVYFLIGIEDNGIGFEQQYAHKIFQIFQRLEGKSEYPGTGIGLSICKKIIVNHKGLIFAESEPGKGATFSIILPQFQ
ncbi:MAG: PAS domain-containing protein [Ferruginibacter sp.]|nr:PAS domain-containing protein [Ferruginibacter sp.]